MDKTTRNILIGVGSAVVIGGTIWGISAISKAREKKEGTTRRKSDKQTKSDIGQKVNVEPALGYSNIRTSPTVPKPSTADYAKMLFNVPYISPNFLGKVETNPVGTVISTTTGDDGYTWYRVKLTKPIRGAQLGYVREDAVSFK